jgi:hypothetical protein
MRSLRCRTLGFINIDLNLGVILSFICCLLIGGNLISMARNGGSHHVQFAALSIGVIGGLAYVGLGGLFGMAWGARAVLLLNGAGLAVALCTPYLLPAGAVASRPHWAVAALSGHTALALLAIAGTIAWARRTPPK